MIYILAGTLKEAQEYAARNNLRRWHYLEDMDAIRRLRRVEILTVGTWDRRENISDIIGETRGRGCTFKHTEGEDYELIKPR